LPACARRDLRSVAARALVAAGAVLASASLTLVILIESAGVEEHADTRRALLRLACAVTLLPVGALIVARRPGHVLGPLLAAGGLGAAVAAAAAPYAVYDREVGELPAAAWIGWISEFVIAPILLIPTIGFLVFPDGRLPSGRWRPALWCGR
jgi:two-component system, NarL family, sensor kinase